MKSDPKDREGVKVQDQLFESPESKDTEKLSQNSDIKLNECF